MRYLESMIDLGLRVRVYDDGRAIVYRNNDELFTMQNVNSPGQAFNKIFRGFGKSTVQGPFAARCKAADHSPVRRNNQ